jgi:hypothetical protein
MTLPSGHEPVEDDEIIYRRIPVSMNWYSASGLSPQAFDPRKDEVSGISVYRAKYKSIEEAAKGLGKQGYYVALLRVGDLRAAGIEVAPCPLEGDPGHAELPGLTCHNRMDNEAVERKSLLAALTLEVKGPFKLPPPPLDIPG